MKKPFILLLISAISQMLNAQIPSYIPKDSLVGWWPFNGNANDESGNGNHGTVNGATLTSDRYGDTGSAYQFDGIDDYIDLSLKELSDKQGISMSIWFNWHGPNGANNHQYIFQIAPNPNGSIVILDDSTLVINVINCNCSSDMAIYKKIVANVWNHVAFTYDLFKGKMCMYLNGKLVDSTIENLHDYYTVNNTPSRIGNYHFNSHYFRGEIDNAGLWNRALDSTEIENIYTQQNTSNTIKFIKNSFTLSPNPVKDILNIQGVQTNANYQITNAIGQTCLQGKFTEKLDVSSLKPGVYFFKTETGTQRFVKE